MYLFIDTETNGKIKNWNLSPKYVDNYPRITQLASQLYDVDRNLIGEQCDLIFPDGWTVPKEQFFIENNMSTERCENEGIPIKDALLGLCDAIKNCDFMIAHNMDFDYPIIASEMIRLNLKAGKVPKKICTMKSTIEFCDLPNKKFPKLVELHMKLFGTGIENAHDALGDVKTTAKCFFKLKELGIL